MARAKADLSKKSPRRSTPAALTQKVTKPKAAISKRKGIRKPAAPTKNARGSFAKATPAKRASVRVRHTVDRFKPSAYSTPIKKMTLSASKLATASKKPTKRVSSIVKTPKSQTEDDTDEADENISKPAKKRARSSGSKTKSTPKVAKHDGKTPKTAKKRSTPTTDDDSSEAKPSKQKKLKKGALTPRPDIKVFVSDPTFNSKENIPFVSVNSYSKMSIRAALMNDVNLMKRLIDDTKNVATVHVYRSVDVQNDPCDYAMLNGDEKMLKLLIDDAQKPKTNRVRPVQSLLAKQGTGKYNFHMLGHAVRPIEMSRGGREGNNAFTKDSQHMFVGGCCRNASLQKAIKGGVDYRIVQQLVVDGVVNSFEVSQNVYTAVRYGHRALAGAIVKDYGSGKFNDLHQHVLLENKKPLPKTFKAVSAKKKGQFNKDITPIHCAAINPNVQYLKDLLAVEPDFGHADSEGHRAIHYAAVCESSEPLEFLLSKGASPYDMTNRVMGVTPLHRACETGRSKNVTVLLEFVKKNDPTLAILKLKSKTGMTPIHYAAMEDHKEVVKILTNYGADVNVQTTAGRKNVTPLMLAAQLGHFTMVEYLHSLNAQLDKRDGLKRTALMHASINGAANIVSYLLREGVNVDLADSSGNTAIHYAAAYGWYICLKLLIDAGADVNVHNAWQLTPLAVAYMKGHMGLVDLLLQQSGTNINCKDDKGMTLVALTIGGGVDESTVDQLKYLINEKNADPTLVDTYGNNPLHLLAVATVECVRKSDQSNEEYGKQLNKIPIDVAKLLMKAKCDPNAPNDQKETPFVLAVKSAKLDLALYFLKNAVISLSDQTKFEPGNENVLHHLVKNGGDTCSSLIFDELTRINSDDVKILLNTVDREGLTPFLRVCVYYQTLHLPEQKESCRNLIEKLLICCPKILENRKIKPFMESSVDEVVEEEEEEEEEEPEDEEMSENDKEVHENGDGDESNLDGQGGQKDGKSKKRDESTNETAFHLISNGHRPLLELLLRYYKSSGAESKILETKDDLGRTPLYRSVCEKANELAILFISAGADVNFVFTKPKSDEHKKTKAEEEAPDRITVLMAAVLNKLRDVVVAILNEKASVHAVDSLQNTALHYACRDQSSIMSEIVTILLESGANVEARNARLRTPLHLICNADSGETDVSTETLEYLLLRNADPYVKDCRGRLPLHYAFVKIGNHKNMKPIDPVAVVTVLLRHMQTKPDMLNAADNWRQSPLHCAARRGANICCISLLRHAEVILNPKDLDGNTPLGLAVYYNHKSCALTLLQANADVLAPILMCDDKYLNLDDYNNKTCWKWAPVRPKFVPAKTTSIPSSAVKNEWQGVIYVIIDMLGKQKDSSLKSLVEAGLEHRKYNFVLTLLRSAKNDARFVLKSSNWSSLLNEKNLIHLLADTAENSVEPQLQLKVVELLIKLGIDLDDHKPVEGPFHPAFYAAKRRNFTLLKFFEENSKFTFDHWMPTSDGHTVFTMLLNKTDKWSNLELLEWLKNFITKHHLSLNLLTKYQIPVDLTNSQIGLGRETDRTEQITPLIRAVHAHDFDLAKLLLKLGADVNFADLDGRTPLMHAVRVNDEHLVKLFLNHAYEIPKDATDADDNEDEEDEDEDDDEEGSDGSDEDSDDAPKRKKQGKPKPKRRQLKARVFTGKGPKMIRSLQSGEGPTLKKQLSKQKSAFNDLSDSLTFKKTSQVDLSKKDNFGRTVIHHLVQPLSYGSWENVELLTMLTKNGASMTTPDNKSKLPYEIACETGQKYMTAEFEKYLKLPLSSKVRYDSFEVPDSTTAALNNLSVNVAADASKYIEERKKAKQKDIREAEEREKRKKWHPHKLSGYFDTGEICADESRQGKSPRPYTVLLTKVDWTGPYGFYNFYRLQLLKRKFSDLYVVFTNWGRIGSPGQYQITPFGSLADGLKEFKSIFRSKTGNDWTEFVNGNFKEQPKKYRPIVGDNDEDADDGADDGQHRYRTVDVDINLETKLKSKLPESLQKLFKDLTDVSTLMHAARSPFAGAGLWQYRNNFPLIVTSLKRDAILKAKNVLTEIGTKITNLESLREQIGKISNSSHIVASAMKVFEEIAEMSLEFYHLLPMKGYEQSDLSIIDNIQVLRNFNGVVDCLLDYERANETLCAAAYQRNVVHPYDYVYKAINCKLQLMTPSDDETQYILHYIYNTSPTADVKAIYKIFSENQTANFDPNKLDNHKLLWHGTGTANLISILSLGLLAAPPQAVLTGSMFGKGIYTADTFQKSQGYCSAGPSGVCYALLCEVALGQINEVDNLTQFNEKDPLKNGSNSLLGVGGELPDPMFDVTLPTGVTMPLGDLIKAKLKKDQHWFQLAFNEYVFYDPRQVVVRYLVAFKS